MEKIVLKHLSGSKANQVEEFPLEGSQELSIGRDPAVDVRFDPEKDDLVSRKHAKISRDPADPSQFILTDLNSRNGTFVNRQRITGSVRIMLDDVIQLGAGGPQLQFDLDPRPAGAVNATRVIDQPQTREAAVPVAPPQDAGGPPTAPVTAAQPGKATVGKATVERMITDTKRQANTTLIAVTSFLIVIIVALVVVGGVAYMNSQKRQVQGEQRTQQQIANVQSNVGMTATQIVQANREATVFFQVGWKMIFTETGGQVYHMFIANKDENDQAIIPNGKAYIPVYYQLPDGSIEPFLTLNNNGVNRPIGGEHTGSGFVVKNDGFILTNRHVAAAWRTMYTGFDKQGDIGILVGSDGRIAMQDGRPAIVSPPDDWVPSESKQVNKSLKINSLEGRNDYLYVSFPKNTTPIAGKTVRVSDKHDVALVKIDVPSDLKAVELNDNYETIQQGDKAIVLGYPGVSPPVVTQRSSEDPFNRQSLVKIVPDPTVSEGLIGRILRGSGTPAPGKDPVYSMFGDAYQLQNNTTGPGNSGGPVFDTGGKVIGVYWAGSSTLSFAVPIRYGMELMGTAPSE